MKKKFYILLKFFQITIDRFNTPYMKTRSLRFFFLLGCIFFTSRVTVFAQTTVCYPLAEDFSTGAPGMPDLAVLPNVLGEDGAFLTTASPPNFCPDAPDVQAFHFEDNTGLVFNSPANFINCDYTVDFLVRFEQLPANTLFDSPWIWLFGAYNEDDGIFIFRDILFNRVFLEFWDGNNRLKSVLFNDFNTTDWFHFTITRSCAGQVKVYINCAFFTDFDDNVHHILQISPATGNQFIFFQDDPQVLSSEAAPGYVRNISISNSVLPENEILEACGCICEGLMEDCTVELSVETFTCIPEEVGIAADTIPFEGLCGCSCDSIITTVTILLPPVECLMCSDTLTVDTTFCAGSFLNGVPFNRDTSFCLSFQAVTGCDSVLCYNVLVLPVFSTGLDTIICPGETFTFGDSLLDISGTYLRTFLASNGCDSLVTLQLQILEAEDISLDTSICKGAFFKGSLIARDTVICETLTGSQGCQTTYCFNISAMPVDTVLLSAEICQGGIYFLGNVPYSASGRYSQKFTSVITGCDSIVVLDLTVLPPARVVVDTTVCFADLYEGILLVQDTLICRIAADETGCETERCFQFHVIGIKVTEVDTTLCVGEAFVFGDIILTEPGGYIGYFESADGCDSLVALTIHQRLPPYFQIYGKTEICQGETSTLYTTNGFAAYQWNKSDTDTTYLIKIEEPGMYSLTVTDDFGCIFSDTVVVINLPEIQVSLVQLDAESCPGAVDGGLEVAASGGQPPFIFDWSTGETQPLISNLISGNYFLEVRDENGCVRRDTFFIPVLDALTLELTPSDPSCSNRSDGSIIAQVQGGQGPYLYALGNSPFQPDSTFFNLEPGNYSVVVQDINGCTMESSVILEAPPSFQVEIEPDIGAIHQGDSLLLTVIGPDIQNVKWFPDSILNCLTCTSVLALPSATTSVFVVAENNTGCLDSASMEITVLQPAGVNKGLVFVPNAFSPNDDGINDRFEVFPGLEVAAIRQFQVFDRWGGLVFDGRDSFSVNTEAGWNGKVKGLPAPAGVYIWKMKIEYFNNSSELLSGEIMLIR